jgi:hypothetical protein
VFLFITKAVILRASARKISCFKVGFVLFAKRKILAVAGLTIQKEQKNLNYHNNLIVTCCKVKMVYLN